MTDREPAPEMTLAALESIGDHIIAAGAYWFEGGTRRLDTLLDQFGYKRTSQLACERSPDDSYSTALAQAYDRDLDQVIPVAVVGIPFFRELYGGPPRLIAQESSPEEPPR